MLPKITDECIHSLIIAGPWIQEHFHQTQGAVLTQLYDTHIEGRELGSPRHQKELLSAPAFLYSFKQLLGATVPATRITPAVLKLHSLTQRCTVRYGSSQAQINPCHQVNSIKVGTACSIINFIGCHKNSADADINMPYGGVHSSKEDTQRSQFVQAHEDDAECLTKFWSSNAKPQCGCMAVLRLLLLGNKVTAKLKRSTTDE